ncbi:hypothetical protein JQX13_52155 [Archangium violaceum]|uniref:hypothetical protein n=1 Tax=Archangium violaceum TaxID=83451 RepID=UPI00193B5F80|nr:hypothetical protein [Archangium violaceum]QRK08381.1 hypothetical protein JQX13_52155 [Archangium violaceum]
MVASVVFLIGLVGVFQGIMVASEQNAMANHVNRASGIASQVRMALDSLGHDRVIGVPAGNGGLLSGDCNPGADVQALAGGMENLDPDDGENWNIRCIFDLDAYEQNVAPGARLLPGYSEADAGRFRRVLVWVSRLDAVSQVRIDEVAIVVSWKEMGRRRFVRQIIGFYDASAFGNATNVEI